MVEVSRREGESMGSLLRRFARRVQQNGVLLKARRIRFYEKPKSKRERRRNALFREDLKKKSEKLRKLGVLEEESFSRPRF